MLKPVKRPGTPFYIARGTLAGHRIERSTGCRKLGDAWRVCRQIETELEAEFTRAAITAGALRFDQAAAIYLTQKPDARYLGPLLRHFGTIAVTDINNALMRAAANALYPHAQPATIRRQVYTPVKAILNLCAADDLCTVPNLKAPAGGNMRTVFALPAEADKIITNLGTFGHKPLQAMATMLFGQGMRVDEAVRLDWEDVSLDGGFAILREPKNGEERRITLQRRCIAALASIRPERPQGRVFLRIDGKPYRESDAVGAGGGQIRYHFAEAVKLSGLDPHRITPHIARHSWATWFHAVTKDQIRLKEEGGWKSTQWLRYTKLGTPNLAKLVKASGWDFAAEAGEERGTESQAA